MYMRVALAIHKEDTDRIIDTYHALSLGLVVFPNHIYRTASSLSPIRPTSVTFHLDINTQEALDDGLQSLTQIWSLGVSTSISIDDR